MAEFAIVVEIILFQTIPSVASVHPPRNNLSVLAVASTVPAVYVKVLVLKASTVPIVIVPVVLIVKLLTIALVVDEFVDRVPLPFNIMFVVPPNSPDVKLDTRLPPIVNVLPVKLVSPLVPSAVKSPAQVKLFDKVIVILPVVFVVVILFQVIPFVARVHVKGNLSVLPVVVTVPAVYVKVPVP